MAGRDGLQINNAYSNTADSAISNRSFVLDNKSLGARIKIIRMLHNHTQAKLASCIDTCGSYISLIESGRREASIGMVARIACLYDVSIDYLIFGREHEYSDKHTGILDSMLADLDENSKRTAIALVQTFVDGLVN